MDNRELASAMWLAGLVALGLIHGSTRAALLSVVRSALQPKLLLPVVGLAAWVLLLVSGGARVGVWTPDLLVPTVIWFLTSGLVLLFNIDRAWKTDHFLRKTISNLVGVTLLVEFFTNAFPLSLPGELLLQPVVAVLMLLALVAHRNPAHRQVERLAELLLGGLGISIIVFSVTQVVLQWSVLDKELLVLELVLPLWLTPGIMPYVFVVALYAAYELAFLRIDCALANPRERGRAKVAAIVTLRHHIRDAAKLPYHWARQTGEAESRSHARRVIRDFRASERHKEHDADTASLRFVRNAGVTGTDDAGRQVDQREFAETKQALQ